LNALSITDIGLKRRSNQDFVYISKEPVGNLPNLFIVADGMGGHNAGDFASEYSVDEFIGYVKECTSSSPIKIITNAITNDVTIIFNHSIISFFILSFKLFISSVNYILR